MKKIINRELIITILIVVLLSLIPLHRIITYTLNQLNINTFLYSIQNVYYLWFFLPIFFLIYLINVYKKKYKLDTYDYIIFVLIILGIISTIFAINKETAIWGAKYRKEGLISILTYFSIFLNIKNMKNDKYKKIIINSILLIGSIQAIYAILQTYTSLDIIRRYTYDIKIASGLSGNPNFLGTYMVITILLSLTLYVTKQSSLYFFITIINFIGLIAAGSLGPLISLIISIIFLLIVFRKKISIKKYLKITVTLLLIFFLTSKSTTSIKLDENEKTIVNNNVSEEIKEVIQKDNKVDISSGRFNLWKNTIPKIKDYWLTGAGYDNFKLIFYDRNTPLNSFKFDKAHNIYLEMLMCNGIFYLITYCALCLIIFIKHLKEDNPLLISIFIAFIGYSIQGFANINVIDITWIFFLLAGLLSTNKTIETN